MAGRVNTRARADVVPTRPAPRRQPRPARGVCRRAGAAPVRARSRSVAPCRPARRASLAASLRALDASLRDRRGRLQVLAGDPVHRVVAAAKEVGATRVHVAADYAPYGTRRDLAVERALAAGGVELVRTGSPYAVAPGRVLTGAGEPYQVFTPFARAWAEHGWRAPVTTPWRRRMADRRRRRGVARRGATRGGGDPGRRRGRGSRALGGVPRPPACRRTPRSAIAPTTTARPGCRRTCSSGEIHPRTMLADLGDRSGDGAARFRSRAGLAGVLRRRPVAPAGLGAARPGARYYTEMEYDTTRPTPFARVAGGAHRLPDRRRRHASTAGQRLDAQPGADGRRQLPGQGPAPGVAARGAAFHAPSGGRRPGLQPARLAVGRPGAAPTRRRTSASSTRSPRVGGSTPTAATCGAGCRSSPTRPTRTSPARSRATRRPSWTMRPSGARRWRGMPACAGEGRSVSPLQRGIWNFPAEATPQKFRSGPRSPTHDGPATHAT